MTIKLAINGFGRIGRCIVRALAQRGDTDLEVVAINDLTDPATLAHLLTYDSVHRTFATPVEVGGRGLRVGGQEVVVTAIAEPAQLPWRELGVDVVLECTGRFVDATKASGHLEAGARRVLVSAPAKNVDRTIVMGVNHQEFDPAKDRIVSNASCTTNCLAPVARVLLESFGVEHGLMTTVHAYTNDQALLDLPHRKGDLRRSRAAAVSMIPSSTGAAKAVAEVIPALAGRFDGSAIRVPTADVSIVDLTVTTRKDVSVAAINEAMRAAAASGPLAGVLAYTEKELVSCDFIGHPASAIFDASQTRCMGPRLAKVFAWYDNEWGFSSRMIDVARLLGA